jgi:hypothetical protein
MATATRRRPAAEPVRPPCAPTGDFSPVVDNRVRTCTLCAEIVELRAIPDGTDWIVVDGGGSAFGLNGAFELCPCYPSDSGLRTRGGRIHEKRWDPDAEIDEKPRHYGPGLNIPDFRYHAHNALGGEVYFTDLHGPHWACGHQPPAWERVRTTDDGVPNPDWREPPRCCGWPMRFAPRGWNCRVDTATWVVPDFGSIPGSNL